MTERASERWPDLFEAQAATVVHAVDQVVAAERLEGWTPERTDVEALLSLAGGELTPDAHIRNTLARVTTREVWTRSRWWVRPRPYLVRGTSVLRNRFDLRDADQLRDVEFAATAARLLGVHLAGPPPIRRIDADHIRNVHRQVFGDVFGWAGQHRIVELSKNGDDFASVATIDRYLREVEIAIATVDWPRADRGRLAYGLSAVYVTYNHAHPFREGNGRTGTLLLHQLCAATGFRLDLSGIERTDWVAASRDSAPFRRVGAPSPRPLIPLLARALRPAQSKPSQESGANTS
ncbi:Fic family protein [Rhodococcus gannanensis]|uniref:protein adenylyltransferase n=1 Tax=Rhodococcus gannanensis TaxID=1960308 RepID=A0ABW4P7C6_9NOCA